MEIYYGSKGVNNFIEAKLSGNDGDFAHNAYIFKMLEGNDINGILKPVINKLDEYIFIRYNITSFSMLEKYFLKQKPDIDTFVKIISCICNAISESEKYLLNPNDLVISANYMLWDMSRSELKLIYIPFYDMDIKSQLKNFIEYIMKIFDYSSADGTMKMHRIYDMVVSDCFDMNILKFELGSNSKSRIKEDMDYSNENNNFANDYDEPVYINFEEDKNERKNMLHEILLVINILLVVVLFSLHFLISKSAYPLIGALVALIVLAVNVLIYVLRKEKEEIIDEDKSMEEFKIYADQITKEYEKKYPEINDCETNCDNRTYAYLSYDDKITDEKITDKKYSSIQNKKEYKLVPLNDGMLEPIILNSDRQKITIGRGNKESDYRLNKEQISRVHASITFNEGGIYIEDQNSTNGTYINSEKIEAFVQKSLNVGDIIKLANEEFFVS
ncbi:MAG: FHA domain-containing protein [Lachnospiraceae bacterium]|nr:FHA domain-containing protein [Lachnospiraceae bacterium]